MPYCFKEHKTYPDSDPSLGEDAEGRTVHRLGKAHYLNGLPVGGGRRRIPTAKKAVAKKAAAKKPAARKATAKRSSRIR
jgi:hypothetical protein